MPFIAKLFGVVTALATIVPLGQGCQSAPPPPGRDYYFSPLGDDSSGTGEAQRPFRSIAKANALRFNPGDRLLFEGNSVLQYNLSEANEGSGYGLYEYPGAPPAFENAIRHNISRNDGRKNGYAGIHVWDDARTLRNVAIHDNRIEMTQGVASGKPPRGLWLQSPIMDAQVHRNVFVIGEGVRLMDMAPGQWQVRFENNVYKTPGDPIRVEWEGREYASLRAWLQETGQAPASNGKASADDR